MRVSKLLVALYKIAGMCISAILRTVPKKPSSPFFQCISAGLPHPQSMKDSYPLLIVYMSDNYPILSQFQIHMLRYP